MIASVVPIDLQGFCGDSLGSLTNGRRRLTTCRACLRGRHEADDVLADDQARSHEHFEGRGKMPGDGRQQMQLAETGWPVNQPLEYGPPSRIAMILERHEPVHGHQELLEIRPIR